MRRMLSFAQHQHRPLCLPTKRFANARLTCGRDRPWRYSWFRAPATKSRHAEPGLPSEPAADNARARSSVGPRVRRHHWQRYVAEAASVGFDLVCSLSPSLSRRAAERSWSYRYRILDRLTSIFRTAALFRCLASATHWSKATAGILYFARPRLSMKVGLNGKSQQSDRRLSAPNFMSTMARKCAAIIDSNAPIAAAVCARTVLQLCRDCLGLDARASPCRERGHAPSGTRHRRIRWCLLCQRRRALPIIHR